MAKDRRNRGKNHLRAIDDSGPVGPAAVDELAQLREILAAAGAPPDVLSALEGPGTPEEIFQDLTDAGVLPSPQDSFAALIGDWEPMLESGIDPFEVELAGYEFLALLRQMALDPDEVPPMLEALIAQAEEYAGPAALAMLRSLAVVAPPPVRSAAAAAADRLTAAGGTDPVWASVIGAPKVGACFGYTDVLGAQESIVITFRYGRKRHAIAVLIDHDLGGGVKDCWATDQPNRIRADYEEAASSHGLELRDFDASGAAAILNRALSEQPCPVQPDQVEDVDGYLDLLRQRTTLLASGRDGSRAGP